MFGYIKDNYDSRDFFYKAPKPVEEVSYVNLIDKLPQIYDQLTLGSCVAQGIAAQIEFLFRKQKIAFFTPSRLKIYFEGRRIIGTLMQDSGMRPRDGMKVVSKLGVCDEKMWPYIIAKFKENPPAECYIEAEKHQVLEYFRIDQKLNALKQCLIEGYPFGFGMEVYESMFSNDVKMTGWVPMPKPKEKYYDGHYVVGVGFDEKAKIFIVRNSWGSSWGMSGYFALPYDFMTNSKLTDDFWTLRLIES